MNEQEIKKERAAWYDLLSSDLEMKNDKIICEKIDILDKELITKA